MADPLSVIASIAGIATAGIQLANALYCISDKLMHAPRAMRDIASNMSLLSTILENLADVLKQGKGVYKPRVITETQTILERFKGVQKGVNKIVKRQGGLRGRMGWVFNSSKVAELLDKIEALKSAMNLVLWTVHLAMVQKSPEKSPEKRKRFRNLVESIVRENRQSIITLQNHQSGKPNITIYNTANFTDGFEDGTIPKASQSLKLRSERHGDSSAGRSKPFNIQDDSIIRSAGMIQNDTATWLYRLVFAPETLPDNAASTDKEIDDPSGNRLPPSAAQGITLSRPPREHQPSAQPLPYVPVEKLRRIEVPAAISNLLKEWTLLSAEDITSIAFETQGKKAEEPFPTTLDDSESDISDKHTSRRPREVEQERDYWDGEDEWCTSRTRNPQHRPQRRYGSSEEYDQWQLRMAQERLKEAEERLNQEKREELLKKRLELKYLKVQRERDEEEARIKAEEDRVKELELKLGREERKREQRAEAEEERKRVIEEYRIKLSKAEEEAKNAKQRIIAEHEEIKQREKDSVAKQREEILAEYEHQQKAKEKEEEKARTETIARYKSEGRKVKEKESLQYDIARELIDSLFGKSGNQESRTYQSANRDVHYVLSTMSDAQLAHDNLQRIQELRRSERNIPEGKKDASEVSDSLSTVLSTNESDERDKDQLEYKVLFATNYNSCSSHIKALTTSLAEHKVDPMFEVKARRERDTRPLRFQGLMKSIFSEDKMMTGTLLWEPSAIPGGSELYESLWGNGWKPAYMRGSDAGQTWFHGPQPIHVRFFRPDYVPQIEYSSSTASGSYLIIGYEWIEQDALHLAGFSHRLIPSGFCVLEPNISYDDLLSLIATSFLLREAGLRRSAKKAMITSSSTLTAKEPTDALEPLPLPAMDLVTGVPKLREFGEDAKAGTANGGQERRTPFGWNSNGGEVV